MDVSRKKILIIVDAPGPAEFIKPVIPLLQKTFKVSVVAVKESPARILAEFHPIACDVETAVTGLYHELQPDILLPATSSLTLGPFVVSEFVKCAAKDKKRIICFQDYWANHRKATNREVMHLWDVVITEDERARAFLLEDGYQGKIIVTGNPAFEKFKDFDVPKERRRVRRALKLPEDEFVVMHAGTGTPQSWREDEITFNFFLDAVVAMGRRLTIIAKAHPRDTDPARYQRLADRREVILFQDDHSLGDVLASVDCIVGMYSTALIHGMYLRIPCISILLQNGGMKRLEEVSLPDFPPNESGACIGVYGSSVQELLELLERIREDINFRKEIREKQETFAPFPKGSFAKNVADAVRANA